MMIQNILVMGNNNKDTLKWIGSLNFNGSLNFYNRNATDYLIKSNNQSFRLTFIKSSITLNEFLNRFSSLNFFIIIIWDGVYYPDNIIKEINDYYHLKRIFSKPYRLLLSDTKGLPKLVSQQILNWKRGIKIINRFRLRKVLKKVSFKYWYEDLDLEGYSRMCKKDIFELKNLI